MDYVEKLEQFRTLFEEQSNVRKARLYSNLDPDSIEVETGYKFDKVYINNGTQRMGRYMVESRTGIIWGIKSWTQVNYRRQYGTLDSIDQYDWSDFYGRPIPGTEAELADFERESEIKAGHKKRGRKPNIASLSTN